MFQSTTANAGASVAGSASASTGYGMEPYTSASPAASGTQASSAFSGQGQYGQGQGNFNQGQSYGQGQGQYGQNQSQYGQSQGQYDQDPGQYGQGQGQYGLGQGQYGLSQGQYGQDYSSMVSRIICNHWLTECEHVNIKFCKMKYFLLIFG